MDIISGIGSVVSGIGSVVSGFLGWDIQKKTIESTEKQNILGVNDNALIMQYAIMKEQEKNKNKITNTALISVLALIGLFVMKGKK